MSDFDSIRADLGRTLDAVNGQGAVVLRYMDENTRQHEELWTELGEIRDAVLALSNRVESLTRATLTEPAEVAAKIVNDANRATLREVTE